MRLHLYSLAFVTILVAGASSAQEPLQGANLTSVQADSSMRLQANPENIQAWLRSKDPRLVAWGAYFARENNDVAALNLAARLVQASLTQGGPDLLAPDGPHVEALSEILDALIQRRIPLSADLLRYVSQLHPVQTIILLSMLPPAEQTGNLMQWFSGARPAGYDHLDRVSAMLLSKAPPPGFAADLLANAEEMLTVHIVPKNDTGVVFAGSSLGGMCLDFGSSPLPAGWPEIFSYHLTENDNAGIDPLLTESGGDQIHWQRSTPGRGFRTCVGSVRGFTPATRHHLLAALLGVSDEAMTWPTQKSVTMATESDEQDQRRLGATILAAQAALLKSVQEFQRRGLITPEEAKATLPKLSVIVRYDALPKTTEQRP